MSSYSLFVDGFSSECSIKDNKLFFMRENGTQVGIGILDVIGIERHSTEEEDKQSSSTVHIISSIGKIWTKGELTFSGEDEVHEKFTQALQDSINKLKGKRNFLVIINPVAGNKNSEHQYNDIVKPLFDIAGITTEILVSERPQHIVEIMETHDFSGKDGVVICGGDGSFYECVNTLMKRTQKEAGIDYNDPEAKLKHLPLIVSQIPTGSMNGMALVCTGSNDVLTVTLNIIRGKKVPFGLCGVYSDGKLLAFFMLLFACGAFADLFNDLEKRRWLKVARYFWIPIYHFLIRRQPAFEAECKCYNYQNSSQEVDGSSQESNEVIINGTFCNMKMLSGDNTDDEFIVVRKETGSSFDFNKTTFSVYEPCTRFQLLSNFMKFLVAKPDMNTQEFIRNIKVTKVDVKLKSKDGEFNTEEFGINVDGEKIELEKPEFQLRLLGELLTVYSSK